MPFKKPITIGKVRSILYGSGKLLGDYNAIKNGRIVDRLVSRVSGKVTSKFNRGVAKKVRNMKK